MIQTSLLIPTKGRPQNIKHLVANIMETVGNKDRIEILFACDQGDDLTLRSLAGLNYKDNNIKCILKPHSDYLNRDYYNHLASIAEGKYLWAIGDDCLFRTKNWDILIHARIEEYLKDKPDRIAYISVYEDYSQAKHPCFPIITKEAFKALDMYFHPELLSWGADRCLYELYSGIDRILQIPEVHIQHLSYHDKTAEFDSTAKSMKERFFRNPNAHNLISINRVPLQIQYLKDCINQFNNE